MTKNRSIDVVSEDVYSILKTAAQENKRSLRSFVNDLLSNMAEADKFLKKRFPHLKKLNQDSEKMFITDGKKDGKVATVEIKENKLQCSLCEKDLMCDHVTYAIIDPGFWGQQKIENA